MHPAPPPTLSVPDPLMMPDKVAEAGLLKLKVPLSAMTPAAASVPPLPRVNVPPLMVVPAEYVFAFVSVTVPLPTLVSAKAPLPTPARVRLPLPPIELAAASGKVQVRVEVEEARLLISAPPLLMPVPLRPIEIGRAHV